MSTTTGSEFQPKKRITTYGKTAKKYGTSNSSGVLLKDESSPAPVKVQKAVPNPPSEPSSQQFSRANPSQQTRKCASHHLESSISSSSRLGRASTVPDTKSKSAPAEEDGISRAKKRKVGAASSTSIKEYAAIYSPPSSPPPVTSPKRSTRPNGVKTSTASYTSTRTAPTADSPMKENNGASTPFSSKTSKTLRELSVDNATPEPVQSIPFRLTRRKSLRPGSLSTKVSGKSATAAKASESAPPARRRKRLIDALAAQMEDGSDEEQGLSQETAMTARSPSPPMILDSSPPPSQAEKLKKATLQRQATMAKKAGPKFTYSQQRTMLAEESMLDLGTLADVEEEQSRAPLLGLGSMMKTSNLSAFSFADDENETTNTGAVRSLHELRQAGANTRFGHQMEDIVERIGNPSAKPSSLRRGALLELAQKMKDKTFRRQFRSHSGDGGLFKRLAEETDIIAGIAIVSILATLLATSPSQHLILQLQSEGVIHLLLLLLDETGDISAVAKDRKRNVSRNAQTTLTTVKDDILKLGIWEPITATSLSPRTLALKAMELIMRQSTVATSETDLFPPTVTDRLFSIVSDYTEPACWDFPAQPESIDLYLSVSLLEHHSISAMQSAVGSRWTTEYLPTVADVLGVALKRPADKFADLESLILRLTLNTTNNNHEAPRLFVNKGVLRSLADATCRAFEVVGKSIMDDAFMSKAYQSLVFMLGVMINFCEHFPPAAQNLLEVRDLEASPLNRLIRVFLDHHSTTADADSMEKTQFNVAFGYLSILLGYLCLHQSVREQFMSIHSKRSLQPLLESMREFISYHRVAGPEANAADRLEGLAHQLESQP